MKRFFLALVLVAVAVPAAAAERVAVPGKTAIRLISDSVMVSTVAVNPGDVIDFHVADPVVVDGWVVIPADAKAFGHFVSGGGMEVHQRLFSADVHARNIVFALDYVVSADGGKIKLDGANQSPPVTNQGEAHPFFGRKHSYGIGLLNKGTVIAAAVDHTVHVMAKEKGSASGGYDQ